ncbi:MAG: hypothetical protein WC998_00885 [Candidatus Paceibacterota bacterium]|jgi:hypothetical protein
MISSFTDKVKRGIEIIILKSNRPPEPPEDKYGHMAMLKKLNETYRCSCGEFFVYKDDSFKILVCPKCGFEKEAPQVKRG